MASQPLDSDEACHGVVGPWGVGEAARQTAAAEVVVIADGVGAHGGRIQNADQVAAWEIPSYRRVSEVVGRSP